MTSIEKNTTDIINKKIKIRYKNIEKYNILCKHIAEDRFPSGNCFRKIYLYTNDKIDKLIVPSESDFNNFSGNLLGAYIYKYFDRSKDQERGNEKLVLFSKVSYLNEKESSLFLKEIENTIDWTSFSGHNEPILTDDEETEFCEDTVIKKEETNYNYINEYTNTYNELTYYNDN